MDLNTVFTKTTKASRIGMLWGGGLSSQAKRVLSQVDGILRVEDLLHQSQKITKNELQKILLDLEKDGYIHRISHHEAEPDWLNNINSYGISADNNYSIAVEEIDADELNFDSADFGEKTVVSTNAEHLQPIAVDKEVVAKAEGDAKSSEAAAAKAKRDAERKAQADAAEKVRREAAEQAKRIAEVEAKARQEVERIAREKAEITARAQAAGRKAKVEAEKQAGEQAALKARIDAAEQARLQAEHIAHAQAEALAKAEAERKLQLELAARIQRQAEEKAQLEAQRIEREKADALAKAKAAEDARLEAEQRAKVEAEEKTRVEAELKARVDAAEQARLQAEQVAQEQTAALARIEAERAAQEELAAKARQEAEQKAKSEAERIARERAEATARAEAEAEEKARMEAELKARIDAAEQARLQAEQIAQEQTAALARIEAERAAQEELAAKARQEAERMERENAEAASRVESEQKVKAELAVKAAAVQDGLHEELAAREEAEEKAWLEFERREREQADAAVNEEDWLQQENDHARVLTERAALADAAEVAMHKAEHLTREDVEAVHAELKRQAAQEEEARPGIAKKIQPYRQLLLAHLMANKWAAKSIKLLPIAVLFVMAVAIGLIHVMNLGVLIRPIEDLASASIGEPVKVHEVHAALFPQPRLVLTDVAIGSAADVKIGAINILSGISVLFADVKHLKALEISAVTLNPGDLGRQMQWINHAAKSDKLKIGEISLKKISFHIPGLALEPLDGKLTLTPAGELSSLELVSPDRNLTLALTPQAGGSEISLTASGWQPPLLAPLEFDEITATGMISQSQASFSQIEAKAYGGVIKAQGVLDWAGRLNVSGNFELIKITLPRLLAAFGSGASVEGTLNAKTAFAGSADQVAELIQNTEITTDFEVHNGRIKGLSLSHAVVSGAASKPLPEANFTRFDMLAGNLQFKDGQYSYRQLELKTEQFQAKGNLDIVHKTVSGKIGAELTSKTQRRQASFNIGGDVADIKLQ